MISNNETNLNTGNYIDATSNYDTSYSDLSTDIYDIVRFIDDIRANNITDLDATAAMVGIFGYITEIFSQSLQDTLVSISETINEALPTRAKFSKNILAHAMNLAITSINAVPATMTLMLYFPLNDLIDNFDTYDPVTDRATFIVDKDMPIYIDEIEFHLDYDIIISRIKNSSNEYVYTAMYDLFETNSNIIKQLNPISNISNPYITTVIQTTVDNVDYLAFSVRVHQVSISTKEYNILTDSNLENKTITFEIGDYQLVNFNIDVEEPDGSIVHLKPIYNGLLDYTVNDNEWCYYEYVSEDTIRVIFSRDSYVPTLNSTVKVNIWTSQGSKGNFTNNTNIRTTMRSDKYNNYNGMYMLIYPLLNGISNGGRDKKSIADLKKIIPREASSRGSIINTTDLNNFFNSINDDSNYIYFFKKRDNPFERLYYAYMITKKYDTVYPTNTLSLKLTQEDFIGFAGNNNLAIKPGTRFYYYDTGANQGENYCNLECPPIVEGLDEDKYPYDMTYNSDGNLVRIFQYICPFLISVDDDLISSYFLTMMKEIKTFKFISVNTETPLQFIATNMTWHRRYIYEDEEGNEKRYDTKYTMDIDMIQNNESKFTLIKQSTDANGIQEFSDCRIRVIMVLYADDTDNSPYRYIEAEIVNYESMGKIYTFRFTLETDDVLDLSNRINITGIYNCKPEAFQHKSNIPTSHGYMNKNTYAKIFILADFSKYVGDIINNIRITEETAETIIYGTDGIGNRTELESIIPTRADIVSKFLTNDLYYEEEDGTQINMVSIMKSHPDYMQHVFDYNGNEQATATMILRYIRNNIDSDFVQNTLLQDPEAILVIESYNYLDLSTFSCCNTLSIDGGINFYHDYSQIMTSVINISKVQDTDSEGNPLYKEITRTDSLGYQYTEYKPIYKINENGTYYYNYTISRIPMLRDNFLDVEESMQDFILVLEERRKYIEECILLLEDTFGLDLKFINTYGPSRRFFYDIPTSENYNVKVAIKRIDVYSDLETQEVIGTIDYNYIITITKVSGLYGYITYPYEGWIRLSDTVRCINYIDNVALSMKFAMEAMTSADKTISSSIVMDIKDYIENIDSIIEIHMPNIITLITNKYREQLKYFEFRGVNQYGSDCQHIYLDTTINADIPPEFLNISTKTDSDNTPEVDITVF